MFTLHLIGERIKIDRSSPLKPSMFRYVFLCLFARTTALLELLYHLNRLHPLSLIVVAMIRFISPNYDGVRFSTAVHYLFYSSLVISQIIHCRWCMIYLLLRPGGKRLSGPGSSG